MAGGVDTGGGLAQVGQQGHGHAGGVMSYAGTVAGRQANGRKKLNVLDIILERKANNVNYNLKKEELSKLLFKKMKLDPKSILKIDTSGFGKLHVEMKEHVNLDGFVSLPAFDIRDGLRVKYYTPHHRKETLVTISWLDLETPDEMLVHIFNHFGQVKSNVKWCKIKQEEGEGELEKLLNNIMNGERQLWMEIKNPLPSYAVIDKRRVKIHHAGQRRTCARCQKVADKCKGNSNAKLCEDNGGEKVNVGDVWKDTLVSLGYSEWKGEALVVVNEESIENAGGEIDEDENDTNITNCDGFVISNLEEETTIDDLKLMLKGVTTDDVISGISMHPTGSMRSKIIKDIDPALANKISKKIDNKSYKGRLLHCRPHVPVSPPSKKHGEAPVDAKETDDQKEDTQKKQEHVAENDPSKDKNASHAKETDEEKEETQKKQEHVAENAPSKDNLNLVNATNANDDDNKKPEETAQTKPTNTSKSNEAPNNSQSGIPGISQNEIKKAKKKAGKDLKKKTENKKDSKKCGAIKKVKELKQHDFMLNSTAKSDSERIDDFVFPGSSSESEEEEVFVDTVGDIDNFITPKPKPYKSLFAKHVETSLNTPRTPSERMKRSQSLAELSPIEREEVKKVKPTRTSAKSGLPRRQ